MKAVAVVGLLVATAAPEVARAERSHAVIAVSVQVVRSCHATTEPPAREAGGSRGCSSSRNLLSPAAGRNAPPGKSVNIAAIEY